LPLNLAQLEQELSACPLVSPYSRDLAIAVVSDVFRKAECVPPTSAEWTELRTRFPARSEEQLATLAHLLASTSLAAASAEGIRARRRPASEALAEFFEQIEPLTAEMIRGNAFRREELVLKWIACLGGSAEGQTAEQTARRIQTLDYRTTLAEYVKAEASRKTEAAERARLLREAAEREAAARGWRE
jgi:hypothetical protein